MNMIQLSFFALSILTICTKAQQEYSGNSALDCSNSDEKGPSSAFLYTCNGKYPSCKAFLIFKSLPPYDSLSAISTLASSNALELAQINDVTEFSVLPVGKEVIIPVNCSCSGQYYQANTTYYTPAVDETYYSIANETYQGLSTCCSIKRANLYGEYDLEPGLQLQVPLRCACPTRNQTANGTKYLLTYSFTWDDNIPDTGERFNVSAKDILLANGFSEEDPTLYPFTTILVPLPTEPSSSQTITRNYKPNVSPPPTSAVQNHRRKRKLYLGVGISIGLSLLFIIILLVILWFYKKRTEGVPGKKGEGKTIKALPEDLLVEIAGFDQVLKVFSFKELTKATENFSPKSKIRGSVYRGVFNGEILGVKRMKIDATKEVNMLNKISHFNLIKLYGVCRYQNCFYLIFEYMENGALRDWLCNKCPKETNSWRLRIQIALDVANGLHYLHNFAEPAYVHKNITSSNILLDNHRRAKISNFSLARTRLQVTLSNAMTTRVVGTKGYMAPEYSEAGSMTPKIDVFAFGVVTLELITRKDAVIVHNDREVLLSALVSSIMEGENAETELRHIIDPCLEENGGMEYAVQVVKLSLTCLRRDPASRPSISEVVSVLMKIQAELQVRILRQRMIEEDKSSGTSQKG
ncbi:hypothetical protein RJ640_021038 [Escallonia rubra]|uniref:Protein kinase domain-containing protein n=1 Tax=Escallonia rubra TaxID=112253 RepID=A0AA88S2H9_9ASTE|nr:hypothetical protein RJ640_021038 [Escallonia rubra]